MGTSYSRDRRSGCAAGPGSFPITATVLMPTTSADAAPKPSVAATEKKLNSQVGELVDRYNRAKFQLDAAEREQKVVCRTGH